MHEGTEVPYTRTHLHPFCAPPDLLQGSLVRAIRRLEELLRQLRDALKSVGDLEQASQRALIQAKGLLLSCASGSL